MRNSGDIAYSSDIIRESAEELGISEEKVKHVFEFFIFYVKSLMRMPNIFSIYLPELGQIYLNSAYFKHVIGYTEQRKEISESQQEALNKAKERLETLDSLLESGYSPHKKRMKFRNMYFTKGKTVKELEELQNKES